VLMLESAFRNNENFLHELDVFFEPKHLRATKPFRAHNGETVTREAVFSAKVFRIE